MSRADPSSPEPQAVPPMLAFEDGLALCDGVPLAEIARRVGTPTVIWSADALAEGFYRHIECFSRLRPMVCFDVACAPTISILKQLVSRGAGMRARSAAHAERSWLAGVPMSRVVLDADALSEDEIRAALDGIYSPFFQAGHRVGGRPPYYRGPVGHFVASSRDQVERLARLAGGLRVSCRVLLRAETSSGAGFRDSAAAQAVDAYTNDPRVNIIGVHAGDDGELSARAVRVARLFDACRGAGSDVAAIDVGGRLRSGDLEPDRVRIVMAALAPLVEDLGVKIIMEPGVTVADEACVAITSVRAMHTRHHAPPQYELDLPSLDPQMNIWPTETPIDATWTPADSEEPFGRFLAADGSSLVPPSVPDLRIGSVVAVFGAVPAVFHDRGEGNTTHAEVLVEDGKLTLVCRRRELVAQVEAEMECREIRL